MQKRSVNSVQVNNSPLYPPMEQDVVHTIPTIVKEAFAYAISAAAMAEAFNYEIARYWSLSLHGIDYCGEYSVKYRWVRTGRQFEGGDEYRLEDYELSDVGLSAYRDGEELKTDFNEHLFEVEQFDYAFDLDVKESYE